MLFTRDPCLRMLIFSLKIFLGAFKIFMLKNFKMLDFVSINFQYLINKIIYHNFVTRIPNTQYVEAFCIVLWSLNIQTKSYGCPNFLLFLHQIFYSTHYNFLVTCHLHLSKRKCVANIVVNHWQKYHRKWLEIKKVMTQNVKNGGATPTTIPWVLNRVEIFRPEKRSTRYVWL